MWRKVGEMRKNYENMTQYPYFLLKITKNEKIFLKKIKKI